MKELMNSEILSENGWSSIYSFFVGLVRWKAGGFQSLPAFFIKN
jgi:hypothetical protein